MEAQKGLEKAGTSGTPTAPFLFPQATHAKGSGWVFVRTDISFPLEGWAQEQGNNAQASHCLP